MTPEELKKLREDPLRYVTDLLLAALFPATSDRAWRTIRDEAYVLLVELKDELKKVKLECPECEGNGQWEEDRVAFGNEHYTETITCPICDGAGKQAHKEVRERYRKFGARL